MSKRELNADLVDENLILALKVREMLKDPKKWCQHIRENEHGQFCVIGHVEEALGIKWWTIPLDKSEASRDKAKDLFKEMGVYGNSGYNNPMIAAVAHNNTHTHAEVLAKFDEGIEHLRQRI